MTSLVENLIIVSAWYWIYKLKFIQVYHIQRQGFYRSINLGFMEKIRREPARDLKMNLVKGKQTWLTNSLEIN